MALQTLRNRYVTDSVETASPGRLLTMLYDRLVQDLAQAEQALADRRLPAAHDRLVHAQDIISALHESLDVGVWPAGAALAELYVYLLGELTLANVAKDGERVATCRGLVEPLRDAWHEAARTPPGSLAS